MSFLERYNAGEHEQVWNDLLELGDQIRKEPLYSQAVAVARQTMLRAKTNIEVLVEKLGTLDYQFEVPDEVYISPTQKMLARITNIENQGGIFPLSVKMFYEVVGEVCFIGAHPQLSDNFELGDYGLDVYSDPFTVAFPYSDNLDYYKSGSSLDANNIDDKGNLIYACTLLISPDSVSKAGDSGGSPYEIYFPNLAIDAPVHNWIKEATFVEFLRENFRWGGFPGFMFSENPPGEILDFLTKDLLPI